ncbi:putative porin [Nibricoccus sp. IMCC34717]|uniref:putative porin n=1 Tax=Nibricoccus sp. IMCC34717 TaxID=3034021 RepID=UPI00384E7DA9
MRFCHILRPALAAVASLLFVAALSAADAPAPGAAAPAGPKSPWVFSGDARLRYERDWDSQTATGVKRADRERERVRLRATATYALDSEWLAGLRLRSGNRHSQQSPHLTLHNSDGTPSDHISGYFDKYYVQYKSKEANAWLGRNANPFWQHAEGFWDEDVTPTGVAGSLEQKGELGTFTTTAGAFAMPDGGTKLHGRLYGLQAKLATAAKPNQWIIAAGFYQFDGRTNAEFLRNKNGERDYLVGDVSVEWNSQFAGLPLSVGADVYHNFEEYTPAQVAPLAPRNANERDGHVISAQLGQLKKAGDWMLYYGWVRIETLATNASYSPDDYVRFGAGPQTDATDIQGHDLRAAYALTKNLNVMVRLLVFEAITTVQDGKRVRLDLNYKW